MLVVVALGEVIVGFGVVVVVNFEVVAGFVVAVVVSFSVVVVDRIVVELIGR